MQIAPEPSQALELIHEATNICLLTQDKANADAVSAMLAFYHLFKEFKRVRVVVPEAVPVACHHLPASSVIEHDLGPKKLAVDLDTNGVQIDQISYLMQGKTFRLIVHPQSRSFDVERVSYSYLGFPHDLFIFFGVTRLAQAGPLFHYDFGELSGKACLNFDVNSENERFASINLVDATQTSVCELIFKMLSFWQIRFNRDVARCLLNGLAQTEPRTFSPSRFGVRDSGVLSPTKVEPAAEVFRS